MNLWRTASVITTCILAACLRHNKPAISTPALSTTTSAGTSAVPLSNASPRQASTTGVRSPRWRQRISFVVGAETRVGYLLLPVNAGGAGLRTQAAPLLIALHGSGGSAEVLGHAWDDVVDADEAAILSLQAEDQADDAPCPQKGSCPGWNLRLDRSVDLDLLSLILHEVENRSFASRTVSIDMKRVYLAGVSNGGFLAYKAAVHPAMGPKLAAVAVVSGNFFCHEQDARCKDRLRVPWSGVPFPDRASGQKLIQVHGARDDVVPPPIKPVMWQAFTSGQTRSIDDVWPMSLWLRQVGCDSSLTRAASTQAALWRLQPTMLCANSATLIIAPADGHDVRAWPSLIWNEARSVRLR
jgi:poly(3-hydroxybutyrate) depolymerase